MNAKEPKGLVFELFGTVRFFFQILIRLGENIFAVIPVKKLSVSTIQCCSFQDGSTLMHIASQCGHPETALMFLRKGVPLHMPNKVML